MLMRKAAADKFQAVPDHLETVFAQGIANAGSDLVQQLRVIVERQVDDLACALAAEVVVGFAAAIVAGRAGAVAQASGTPAATRASRAL